MTEDANAGKKKLYTVDPDEIQDHYFHGQFLLDRPGQFINFACEDLAELEQWARRLADFLSSDEPYLEHESPHLPGRNFITRYGASRIVAVDSAWSRKVRPKLSANSPLEVVRANL